MRIVVIGAGVVGVATAWYLTRDGHDVQVIERREGPGLETSFGNAGGVCPGFAGPWAAPGMPRKALGWMFRAQAPLKIRPRLDIGQWRWLAQFVANCTPARFATNKAQMQEMAHFSLACLRELRRETGIEYDHGTAGVLQVFSSDDELAGGRRAAEVLKRMGVAHRLVGADDVRAIEPALASSDIRFTGGLHLYDDETGDCHLFTTRLAERLAAQGCRFDYGMRAERLITRDGRVAGVGCASGEIAADAVVLATGPWAKELLRPLGLSVPVYPVKGYSLTAQITDAGHAPRSSVMDEHSKVMVTRLGDRIRAAGVAELAGFDPREPAPVIAALRERVAQLFPGAADYSTAETWHGFRPMTPSGPSIVTKTGYDNLYFNLGHGSNGWTQACGTARRLADLVADRARPQ